VAILKLVSSVTQREFMNAIRGKSLAPTLMAEIEKYVERQPTLASLRTVPPWMPLFERSGSAGPGVFERQIVATRLRMYIDEWIDTGVLPNVGEAPLERDLAKAPTAAKLLRDYVEQNRPTLPLSPNRLEFVFEICHAAIPCGSLEAARRSDLVSGAFEEAARLFTGLLLSEWGHRLCRCRYRGCGQYFLKERLRVAPLVHGTFCRPEHQRKASAEDCVRKSRANQRKELIERAAAILIRWRIESAQWHQDGNSKRKLAAALSATHLCRRTKLVFGSS
jgi:hypothetical protein